MVEVVAAPGGSSSTANFLAAAPRWLTVGGRIVIKLQR